MALLVLALEQFPKNALAILGLGGHIGIELSTSLRQLLLLRFRELEHRVNDWQGSLVLIGAKKVI